MPFQMPITIADVLQRIQTHEYVLPAIQREFVWNQDQIKRLFDSLLRGYPIGSFLFWSVDAGHVGDFKFYGFIKDYHQLTAPHCPVVDLPMGKPVTAILDGQQRLTALNIGLRGSHAQRLPGKWYKNLSAYPVERLHLNLARLASENELGMVYEFEFFKDAPPDSLDKGVHWFPVHRILDADLADAPKIFKYIQTHGLATNEYAFEMLNGLLEAVKKEPVINYYEEKDQSIDKVLDIFIRVNSGGTMLGYSDLLLSIATAQWEKLDARQQIHQLVDELNGIGQGFDFPKDTLLKAGLVLTDVPDVGFKVTNFNHANMVKLEGHWEAIENALRIAVGLLADFGFSGPTLSANSVLIPIAYYVYRRRVGESYRTASQYANDRAALRSWVVRSLVKSGIWGSGLDTLLRELRRVIVDQGSVAFPLAAIESAMAARGKSLAFMGEEIDDLLETPYGHKRAFPLLALLFPHVDTRNQFHMDHVFPRALFKRSKLLEAGVPATHIEEFEQLLNGLPNLQLLEGPVNVEKQDTLPLTWALQAFPDPAKREHYFAVQDLEGLPPTMTNFPAFYLARKERLGQRLRTILGVASTSATAATASVAR